MGRRRGVENHSPRSFEGDSTRTHFERGCDQIVELLVLQIGGRDREGGANRVLKGTPQKHVPKRIWERVVDLFVPQFLEKSVEEVRVGSFGAISPRSNNLST